MVVELKGGLRTLWLRFDSSCNAPHQIFYKEHSVRNQEAQYPKGRTLFVLNVPPWTTAESLKEAFARLLGPVKLANLTARTQDVPNQGFGKAFIVFERESSLDKALELQPDTTVTLHEDDENTSTVGLNKWCREYNSLVMDNEASIKKDIEEYMREYDERVARRAAGEENADGEEDEDGWVTVTGKKKRGQFAPARKESTMGKLQSKEERKNRKKELLNFYTFQIRESKKKHLVELRKKFELDKKKLEQLKTKRTFKPF